MDRWELKRSRQKQIGRLVRDRREMLGLTKAQLGARIARLASTIGVWESGGCRIGQHTIPRLATALGVEAADLTNEFEQVNRQSDCYPKPESTP
jgi:transcriptional regulator with XRE-family HTH domain